jgi:hypothetical protein
MTFYFLQDVPSPMEEEAQKNLEEEKSSLSDTRCCIITLW